jgi:hypothetical protein
MHYGTPKGAWVVVIADLSPPFAGRRTYVVLWTAALAWRVNLAFVAIILIGHATKFV